MTHLEPEEKDSANIHRHWDSRSERYTGGDALVTALDDGWLIRGVVFRQEHWLAGVRRVTVYHVELVRDGQRRKMMVLQNPYVTKLLYGMESQVVLINQRKETAFHPYS
ncbi:MAG: hypothetical protein J0M07_23465 [Anaerolineae bacterium]|nr:hypothetical protein [Anaerolineae bacterium]